MSTAPNPLADMIKAACQEAIAGALSELHVTPRLLRIKKAALHIDVSLSEMYEMVEEGIFTTVKRGRCTMLDILELNEWIALNKTRRN